MLLILVTDEQPQEIVNIFHLVAKCNPQKLLGRLPISASNQGTLHVASSDSKYHLKIAPHCQGHSQRKDGIRTFMVEWLFV